MKIAVSATGPQIDASVDPRFGRCPWFVIVETDDLSSESFENTSQALGQGAGIQSARAVVERGARFVLTGNCGPNAHQALTTAGIGVVLGCTGTVRQVVEQFKAGSLQPSGTPNVAGHGGLASSGGGAPGLPAPNSAAPTVPSYPPGGMGGGQGMGRGRGQGRGCGSGGGGGGRGGQGRGRCGGRGGNA